MLQTRKYENVLMKSLKNFLDFDGGSIDHEEEDFNNLIQSMNPENMDVGDWQDMQSASKTMSVETAKKLLRKVNLIGATTPHRLSKHIKGEGYLMCSDRHHYIVDQQLIHEHTAICLSDCYFLEL